MGLLMLCPSCPSLVKTLTQRPYLRENKDWKNISRFGGHMLSLVLVLLLNLSSLPAPSPPSLSLLPPLPLSPFPLPPPSQSISSRPAILESALFRDFLKSGVAVLRDFNAHNLHKSRKRKLLGIMKGHSEDMEEAKVRCHMIIML